MTTSQKRCKKCCGNPPFCLAQGRKPVWPRMRKPLFCRGMRVDVTTCVMVESLPRLGWSREDAASTVIG